MLIQKRKHSSNDVVSMHELKQARVGCARLIKELEGGEKLLPIFERLDKEIARREQQEIILQKALEIANDNINFCDTNCDT